MKRASCGGGHRDRGDSRFATGEQVGEHSRRQRRSTVDGSSSSDRAMIDDAIRASSLALVPPSSLARMLTGSVRVDVPAGRVVYAPGDPAFLALVLAGLVRVHMLSATGRQVTALYVRRGRLLGVPALFAGPGPVGLEAMTDSTILQLNMGSVEAVAGTDVDVVRALATDLAWELRDMAAEYAVTAFGSVRQRVASHLLALGLAHHGRGPFPVTQRELADAVGSVREVVARVLRQLRAEGLVRTGRTGIIVLDPERLYAEGQRLDADARAGDQRH